MIKEYYKKYWETGFDFFLAIGQGIILFFVVVGTGIKISEGIKRFKKRKKYKNEGTIILK